MEATLLLCAALVSAAPADLGLASSDNFIVHAPSQQLADGVLHQAEQYREELARAWLGAPLAAGDGPVIIHVRISAELDHAAMLPSKLPQRTHTILSLKTSREMACGATLPHELLHCVLATRYGEKLPVFAQEGCAGEQDDAEVRAVRRRILAQMSTTGRYPRLRTVLDQGHIAATDQTAYTVSCSLAEFLFARRNRTTFLQFAVDGASGGWDAAARRHYGYQTLTELETDWHRWVDARTRLAASGERRFR